MLPEKKSHRIVYLCLERLRPGQAAHTHVMSIVEGLRKDGFEVELISTSLDGQEQTGWISRLRSYASTLAQAIRTIGRADLVYIRAHPAALPLAVAAGRAGKPLIHEINGRTDDIGITHVLPRMLMFALRWSQRRQFRKATALVAVTPGLAVWAKQQTNNAVPVHMIVNGADGGMFHPDAKAGPVIDRPYVLFFGGLSAAWHGIATMRAAVKEASWPSQVVLAVAGEGPRLSEFKDDRSPQLHVLGFLPANELAGLAARSLAVLVPIDEYGARDEGGVAPLKLFEGMASGRPVIATDLPFQGDLVRRHQCGLVINPGDHVGLAKAVRLLVEDPVSADMMGKAGRAAIENEYDWHFRVVETRDMLNSVLAGWNRP